jgi:hypothetical protein
LNIGRGDETAAPIFGVAPQATRFHSILAKNAEGSRM